MGVKRGMDCVLARNTGTNASPTWNVITKARDVSRDIEVGEAEAGARDSAWEVFVALRKKLTIEFEHIADPAVDDYDALVTACDSQTVVEFAIANGAIATSGTRLLRVDCQVFSMKEGQPLDGVVMDSITLKPTYSSNVPTFSTVS